jgi:hypothetical protein
MLRILPLVCATALLVASGALHRVWTGAWTSSDNEPSAFAARLANVPQTIGEWQGTDGEVDPSQLTTAEAVGHVLRKYVHRDSGAEVSVFILCGRPGPMSVHSPSICYGGIGFEPEKESHYNVPAEGEVPEADFNRLDLVKHERVTPTRLRVYYAWNSGGRWTAPSNPRLKFGGVGALYKMYVIYRPAPGSESAETDPAQDLLRELLPELQRDLSPAS